MRDFVILVGFSTEKHIHCLKQIFEFYDKENLLGFEKSVGMLNIINGGFLVGSSIFIFYLTSNVVDFVLIGSVCEID